MNRTSIAGVLALALALAACGERGTPQQNGAGSVTANKAAATDAAYSAAGNVTGLAGGQVTIAHGPVAGLGWPAMTMTFTAPDPQILQGIAVGDAVAFQFRESGGSHVLTSISKQ